ncbi:nicastrin-like isoform X1 [Asterias amurensis]|uniref:nicastrin-like isoform X1 n=2 Tax=Asterias amurensis TaxID=7602 RepID=UPI003AB45FB9
MDTFVVKAFLVVLMQFVLIVSARKTQDMIYTDIKSTSPCVRRFNATHQIGCTSDFYGNTGVIHYMASDSDVQWVIDNGPHQPYIPLMEPHVFNYANVMKLVDSKKVGGILVININSTISQQNNFYFSPDRKCPNQHFGYYNNESDYGDCPVEWNPDGNAMNFMDLKVPILSLYNEAEVNYIIKCYKDHNEPMDNKPPSYPLCATEVLDFMYGAKDTPTCMRRTQQTTNLELSYFCDPLGDYNSWVTLVPTNKTQGLRHNSLILVAAQVDATSLFYHVLPRDGAEHSASSFITLLAVVQALGALNSTIKQDMDDIMFVFFQGESYDYIGSSRMVYDMRKGQFPFKENAEFSQPAFVDVDDIAYYLELNQLGLAVDGKLFAHTDPITQQDQPTKTQTDKLLKSLQSSISGSDITINKPSQDQPLPPASFHRFLRSGVKVPGIVLTDHEKEYRNRFYNSRFDTAELLQYEENENSTIFPLATELATIATTISRALYKLARPEATDADLIQANATIVNDMLYCFLIRANCRLFRSIVSQTEASSLSNSVYPSYVGVFTGETNSMTKFIQRLLGFFTGSLTSVKLIETDETQNQCKTNSNDQIFQSFLIQGPNPVKDRGYCVESTVNQSPALSPAFIEGEEDWASTEYSTWTESQWGGSSFSLRVYLKPSTEQESLIFSLGMIILLVSLLLSYFLNARASIIFSTPS